jgi:hypothetical protein
VSRIFLSYRRDDSAGHTSRLYDWLSRRFGEDAVFMDIDAIEPGEDFVEVVQRSVGSADALIAVIGRSWLTAVDPRSGGRRLDDPNDVVRLEVKTALERNIRVIPMLVQGATMPAEIDLPEELAPLARRNALDLDDLHWKDGVDRLIATLTKVLGDGAPVTPQTADTAPAAPPDARDARDQQRAALRAIAPEGGGGRVFGIEKEIQSLPDYLAPDELVLDAARATKGRLLDGVLAATSRRVVWLAMVPLKPAFFELAYEQIVRVDASATNVLGRRLRLTTTAGDVDFHVNPPERGIEVAEHINNELARVREGAGRRSGR